MNVILKCLYGSHLFGTNTENSDKDYKVIFIESLDNIILGGKKLVVNTTTNEKEKNTKDDVDSEFIELRKFIKDALNGQTYALDILFCNKENILYKHHIWDEILEHRELLVCNNITPFLGFCQGQVSKYQDKIERYEELSTFISWLHNYHDNERIEEFLCSVAAYKHIHIENGFLNVLDKTYPVGNTVKVVLSSLEKLEAKYGNRSKQEVDWKSISHAYRVAYELRELLNTHKIQFPLSNRAFIKKVKLGQISLEFIEHYLPKLIEEVKELPNNLPDPDPEFWKKWVLKTYKDFYRSDFD